MTGNILLLEDDKALSMGIEYMLAEEGFQVDSANCITEAEELFNFGTYDLLILDIMLPDGTGYDFCVDIRKKSDVPVIFLTALDQEVNVVMGLDFGADDYITKPFRSKELLARINSILRRNQGASCGSCIVTHDDKKMCYMINGSTLDLTAREYRLLRILISNAGKVMTRDMLLEGIWDTDASFVDDNTLSVYIKRLREKLGDSGSCIKTIRSTGYRWDE